MTKSVSFNMDWTWNCFLSLDLSAFFLIEFLDSALSDETIDVIHKLEFLWSFLAMDETSDKTCL